MIWELVQVAMGAACVGMVFLIDNLVRRWQRWRLRAKFNRIVN